MLGSLNLDVLLRVPHLPRAGETMHSHGLDFVPGGKGANQAAACAALGTRTRMVGAVGADEGGTLLRAALEERGVDVSGVRVVPEVSTGQAYIHVAPDGENTITLHGGANGVLGEAEVQALDAALAGARVLLLQLEVPLGVNIQAAQRARAAGVTVILDPAPAVPELPRELLSCVDILTPNEHEARTLTGETDPRAAAQALGRRGVSAVIVKRGSQSTLLLQGGAVLEVPVPAVQVVSTVAAGDTFNGALASALAAGQSVVEATAFGVRVASLRVSRAPGYGHLPTGAELEAGG